MSERRHPYDGKPYYCATCGLGFGEVMACEEPDCKMEDEIDAKLRAERRNLCNRAEAAEARVAELEKAAERMRERAAKVASNSWSTAEAASTIRDLPLDEGE